MTESDCVRHTSATKEKKKLYSYPAVYVVVTCPDNSRKPEKALSGYLVQHLGTFVLSIHALLIESLINYVMTTVYDWWH